MNIFDELFGANPPLTMYQEARAGGASRRAAYAVVQEDYGTEAADAAAVIANNWHNRGEDFGLPVGWTRIERVAHEADITRD